LKVGIYARYSSDNQRDASIADQLRVCREFAARQGWTVVQEFTDHAISGATLLRSGFQGLMRDSLNQRFDVVLAEALDRFSRDQEDTAGLFKHLCGALEAEESRTGAADAIRALVEAILLEPDGDELKIILKGDLAGMLSAARDSKRSPDTGDLLVQIKLVAGTRNRRYLQLWSGAA
jgi:hypothetical protein